MAITKQITTSFGALEKRGMQPNFLFFGDSVLHLSSFRALYSALDERGCQLSGVVCNAIAPGRKAQFGLRDISLFIPTRRFEYLENTVNIDLRERPSETVVASVRTSLRLKNVPSGQHCPPTNLDDLAHLVQSGAMLYVHSEAKSFPKHSVDLALLLFGAPLIDVLIEEGTGTYTQTDRSWFEISLLKTRSHIMRLAKEARWALFAPLNNLIQREYSMKVPRFSFCMFTQKTIPLEINVEFRDMYKKVLEQSKHDADYKNAVIFASTVLFEECESNADLPIIKHIVNIAGRYGIRVVIKPHPREKDLSRYASTGANLEEEVGSSLEELVAAAPHKPRCILGFGSSSQVMLNALYGIPAIDLSRLFASRNDSAASNIERLSYAFKSDHLERFRTLFSPYIVDVKDDDELTAELITVFMNASSF